MSRTRTRLSLKVLAPSILALFATGTFAQAMDPDLRSRARRAVDEGLSYLRDTQAENGAWSNSVGVTALALRAFLESHRGYDESDGAFITRPVNFILSHVNEDGSISESNQNTNYNTAVAIIALEATGNPAYDEIIANAQRFLLGLQIEEDEGYEPEHRYYGGIGYGGDERPDLSNQYMAMEALRTTALDPDDPVWERALIFINRSQNRSESNDQEWAGNDGGFTYMPGYSPHGDTGSYGGMTHAGLIALLFAGVDKNDPRVQAAYDWIKANYTLEDNPGALNGEGLFYYYTTFAKSMTAYGEDEVTDADGNVHNWRNDLAAKLLELQDSDGSWINERSGRWWEDNRDLTTARAAIALNLAAR
jgi:squalene-hopene/tetraprenyl-beta-curcumene cyclase